MVKIIDAEAAKVMADFDQAAILFAEVQQEHAWSLQHNQVADVREWSDERSRAMGRLQQALNAVWGCDVLRSDARIGSSLQERIGQIIARERELVADVKSCQSHLQGEMARVRKGKKAMGGYGAVSGARSIGLCFKNSL